MTISATGEITFVNIQMERLLQHNEAYLIGSNIESFVAPDSRKELRWMIRDLVLAEQQAFMQDCQEDMDNSNASEHTITSQASELSFITMDEKVDSGKNTLVASGTLAPDAQENALSSSDSSFSKAKNWSLTLLDSSYSPEMSTESSSSTMGNERFTLHKKQGMSVCLRCYNLLLVCIVYLTA